MKFGTLDHYHHHYCDWISGVILIISLIVDWWWLVFAVHEHEEGEWEAYHWWLGFQDVKVESCGRKSEWGRESQFHPRFVSEHRRGGWFWIVSQGLFFLFYSLFDVTILYFLEIPSSRSITDCFFFLFDHVFLLLWLMEPLQFLYLSKSNKETVLQILIVYCNNNRILNSKTVD